MDTRGWEMRWGIQIYLALGENGLSYNILMALGCFSLSNFQLPVLTPPVNIHAPVVMAALMRPFPKTCLSFGWSSKFCRPPCTEMRSLGSSSCHSLVIRCRRRSGFVSKDTRTYWKKKGHRLGRQGRARQAGAGCLSLPIPMTCAVLGENLSCEIWFFEKRQIIFFPKRVFIWWRDSPFLKVFLKLWFITNF